MDMNGLKQVNDALGHDAGDSALKAYFQAVASVLGDNGQAYRLGGDEVLALLPGHDETEATAVVGCVARMLMNERLFGDRADYPLSIAAGVVTCVNPNERPAGLRSRANDQQRRAKGKSKETSPRPSVIAFSGNADMIVLKHAAEVE
jgi:diguanylate cyclase (GGDEF)-like protein